jgi:hypothetical protein
LTTPAEKPSCERRNQIRIRENEDVDNDNNKMKSQKRGVLSERCRCKDELEGWVCMDSDHSVMIYSIDGLEVVLQEKKVDCLEVELNIW